VPDWAPRAPRGSWLMPPVNGLTAAVARGRASLDRWVADGVVLPTQSSTHVAASHLASSPLPSAVATGFQKGIRGRRYYVSAMLDVEAAAWVAVCRAPRWPGRLGELESEQVLPRLEADESQLPSPHAGHRPTISSTQSPGLEHVLYLLPVLRYARATPTNAKSVLNQQLVRWSE
jgi:hypothetical protein